MTRQMRVRVKEEKVRVRRSLSHGTIHELTVMMQVPTLPTSLSPLQHRRCNTADPAPTFRPPHLASTESIRPERALQQLPSVPPPISIAIAGLSLPNPSLINNEPPILPPTFLLPSMAIVVRLVHRFGHDSRSNRLPSSILDRKPVQKSNQNLATLPNLSPNILLPDWIDPKSCDANRRRYGGRRCLRKRLRNLLKLDRRACRWRNRGGALLRCRRTQLQTTIRRIRRRRVGDRRSS